MQFQSVSLNYQLNHFKNFQGTCISLQDLQDICMYCQQSQTWWRVAHLHGLKIKGHCKRPAKLIIPGISGGWRCRLLWLYVAVALVAVLFNGETSMASPQRWKIVSSIRNQV
jgi:hypothetical protein